MHEVSVAADLVQHIEKLTKGQKCTRVVAVHLKVDPWRWPSPDHLREHFIIASRGTVAQGAVLKVEVCDCPVAVGGGGLLLKSLEIEE